MNMRVAVIRAASHVVPFIHPVASDVMAPTYRSGQNSLICLPVDAYVCEGVCLVDGEPYRCERIGRNVRVWRDNPAHTGYNVDVDLFNSSPLALVVADITVRNAIGRDIMQVAA